MRDFDKFLIKKRVAIACNSCENGIKYYKNNIKDNRLLFCLVDIRTVLNDIISYIDDLSEEKKEI